MNKVYIAKNANQILQDYLISKGVTLEYIQSKGIVDAALSNHPDIFLCKLGIDKNAPVLFAETGELGCKYPQDVAFNAACTGKYFIHHLGYTNPRLLQAARDLNMELIHVPQGYAKCSTVVVDQQAVITYDQGIIRACSKYPDLQVLQISPGHIHLEGYDTGFIGGCSGKLDGEILFNGDLSAHPDFLAIKEFIQDRGLSVRWFSDYPLTDIGSIL